MLGGTRQLTTKQECPFTLFFKVLDFKELVPDIVPEQSTETMVDERATAQSGLNPVIIWTAAAAVAALGAWIIFDALPGINWLLCTVAAVVGLGFILTRNGRGFDRLPLLAVALAIVIAAAAALTADPFMYLSLIHI